MCNSFRDSIDDRRRCCFFLLLSFVHKLHPHAVAAGKPLHYVELWNNSSQRITVSSSGQAKRLGAISQLAVPSHCLFSHFVTVNWKHWYQISLPLLVY